MIRHLYTLHCSRDAYMETGNSKYISHAQETAGAAHCPVLVLGSRTVLGPEHASLHPALSLQEAPQHCDYGGRLKRTEVG